MARAVTNEVGHGAHGPQKTVLGESRIIIKSDGLAQRGCDAVEGQHDRNGFSGSLSNEPRCKRYTGFALMENEHGPCALADDEVALPSRPFMDGDPIFDHIS